MISKIPIITLILSFGFLFTSFPQDQKSKEEEMLEVNISEVVSNPKSFDRKRVYLEGIVKGVKYTTSSKGIPLEVDPEIRTGS